MDAEKLCSKYNLLNQFKESREEALNVIKSNLMYKYKLLEEKQGSDIDSGIIFCKWCFNTLSPEKCRIFLKPQKRPKSRMRSLLKKDESRLNNFQRKLVDKIKRFELGNTLVFNCMVCLKNTQIPLKKDNIKECFREKDSTENINSVTKKKKKKKDLFAGLNAKVVQQYKKSSENEASKKVKPPSHFLKKVTKEISFKQQLRIHQALLQTPAPKKKPSQLALFLDNM